MWLQTDLRFTHEEEAELTLELGGPGLLFPTLLSPALRAPCLSPVTPLCSLKFYVLSIFLCADL